MNISLGRLVGIAYFAVLFGVPRAAAQGLATPRRVANIFTTADAGSGENIHLPSLLVTRKGTVIAVCQLRKGSAIDFGHDTDILLRRSTDGGKTWEPIQVVYRKDGVNAVNGPIVQDARSGVILLPVVEVPAKQPTQAAWVEHMVRTGGNLGTIASEDDGKTWGELKPRKPLGPPGLVAWPSNSSHGVQLPTGRLVLGAFLADVKPADQTYQECEYSSALVYSDDAGQTWRIGARVPYPGTDEIAIAQASDGALYANFRHNNRNPYDLVRGVARSRDAGQTFPAADLGLQDRLSRCDCHVGLVRYVSPTLPTRSVLLYSGPTGMEQATATGRHHLALRVSYDDGRTWPVSQVIVPASAAYSDLAVTADGDILCLYGVDTFAKTAHMDLLRFKLGDVENVFRFGDN